MLSVRLLAAALVATAATSAVARDVEVRSRLDHVLVYPDGATVTRLVGVDVPKGEVTLVAADFPVGLDPQSLRVEGAGSGGLAVLGVAAKVLRGEERPAGADALKAKLDATRLEREAAQGRLEALQLRRAFAERYAKEVPFAPGKDEPKTQPVGDWRTAFAAIGEEVEQTNKAIIETRDRLRRLDQDIARLEQELRARPVARVEVRIDVAAEAAAKGELRVSYTVRNARWLPVYDARLESGRAGAKPTLELVRRAEVTQRSGEDWTDVALSVSTVRTAAGTQAPDTPAALARYAPPRPPMAVGRARDGEGLAMRAPMPPAPAAATAPATEAAPPPPVQEPEAQVDDGAFQVVWRVPGRVTVASGEGARILRLASQAFEPDLQVKVAAALDTTPYLEAQAKHADDAPLLAGRVALYRDGTYVGEGRMPATTRDETLKLGFGADERIKVTRTLVKRLESGAGIVSSSKVERQEYRITVRNGRDVPVKVTIEDRMPYSETSDIQVEPLGGLTAPTVSNVADKRGVMAWTYDMAPGETREVRFGWRLRWPADKPIVIGPRS